MQIISTDSIHDEVKKKFLSNRILMGEDLLVSSDAETIILHGLVGSLDKKWLAEDIARGTFGVLNVINQIHVKEKFQNEPMEGFYEDF